MTNIEGRLYTMGEVAKFFNKTAPWVYWCFRNEKFVYENGEPIEPISQTPNKSRKAFDLDGIQEMALSLYRIGNLSEESLGEVIRKILVEKEKFSSANEEES